MLFVQPTSTCDVCLDRYAWNEPSNETKPHAIACGHVFCYRCLQTLRSPRTCPLCRRGFHLTRAARLHVDLATEDHVVPSVEESEARRFEERIAHFAASGDVANEECRAAIEEVSLWLENTPVDAHKPLRSLVSILKRYETLQQDIQASHNEIRVAREEREHYRRVYKRSEREREQDKLLHQGVDQSWEGKMTEVVKEYEKKLAETETQRNSLEDELRRLQASMNVRLQEQAEAYALLYTAHSRLNPQTQAPSLPQTQSRGVHHHSQEQTNNIKNHIPAHPTNTSISNVIFPTTESNAKISEHSTNQHVANTAPLDQAGNYVHATYTPSNNPLPRPPEPIPISHLPEFARPGTTRSYKASLTKMLKREKNREKERESGRKEDRGDLRQHGGAVTDMEVSGQRVRRDKDRDRGTDRSGPDTSATETQERRRSRRTRHSTPADVATVPANVVGGWGLERALRPSLNGPRKDLTSISDPFKGNLLREEFDRRKDKGKGKETDARHVYKQGMDDEGEAEASDQEYVFVRSTEENSGTYRNGGGNPVNAKNEIVRDIKGKGKARERRVDSDDLGETRQYEYSAHYPDAPPTRPAKATSIPVPAPVLLPSSTLVIPGEEPSALGLYLVPSPDGRGYEYRYAPAQQSEAMAQMDAQTLLHEHGEPSEIRPAAPVASYFSYTQSSHNSKSMSGHADTDHSYVHVQSKDAPTSGIPTGVEGLPTLNQHASGSVLSSQVQSQVNASRHGIAAKSTAESLLVPQPRRISMHNIPEPSPSPVLASEGSTLQQSHSTQQASSSNPNLLQMQLLKHKTSTTSTTSMSTAASSGAISLTGTTGEKRKQLLDALFADGGIAERSGPTMDVDQDANASQTSLVSGIAVMGNVQSYQNRAHRGIPSVDGRPSRGLSSRPPTAYAPAQSSSYISAQHRDAAANYHQSLGHRVHMPPMTDLTKVSTPGGMTSVPRGVETWVRDGTTFSWPATRRETDNGGLRR